MPSLDQSAERIIYITHTRGSGSARIAVMAADSYLMAFEASQIDKERARLIAVLEEKGPGTQAIARVIHAIEPPGANGRSLRACLSQRRRRGMDRRDRGARQGEGVPTAG
jgi:hypothetical protein